MRPEIQSKLDNIIDCMSGADGGAKLTIVRTTLEEIDKEAKAGDVDSITLIEQLIHFSALIDAIVMVKHFNLERILKERDNE